MMAERYVAVRRAALESGITQNRIRYWMMRDPEGFPYALRNGVPVVRVSEVEEYFRRREEVQVVRELDEDEEEDEEEDE